MSLQLRAAPRVESAVASTPGDEGWVSRGRWHRDAYAPRYRHERHDRRDEYRRDGRRGNGHGKFDNRGQRKGHGRD